MTLTEARKTLEQHRGEFEGEIKEAIDTAISTLPRESARPTAAERLAAIRAAVADAKGFDPFATRRRDWESVVWRQCAWMTLSNEGYSVSGIGAASGYNHATVYMGVARLRDYLACGDRTAVAIWQDFVSILGKDT